VHAANAGFVGYRGKTIGETHEPVPSDHPYAGLLFDRMAPVEGPTLLYAPLHCVIVVVRAFLVFLLLMLWLYWSEFQWINLI